MITKERLEELIEQGAMIWVIYENKIYPHKAKNIAVNGFNCVSVGFDFEYLFETKEDALEYVEFGNITRTERLELPSWEDVKKDSETLKYGTYTIAEHKYLFSLNLRISKPAISEILLLTETDNFNWNLTRENYNEARRLCVKLFKGEDDAI